MAHGPEGWSVTVGKAQKRKACGGSGPQTFLSASRKWATDIPVCKQEVGHRHSRLQAGSGRDYKLLAPPPVACFLQEGSTPNSTTNQRTLGLNLRAHRGPLSFKLPYLLSRKLVHFMRPPVNPSEGCPLDRITLHKAFPVKGYIASTWLC